MMHTHSLFTRRASLAIAATLAGVSSTFAAVQSWNVDTGDFLDGANWTPGFVGEWPLDVAEISNGGTATMSAGVAVLLAINVGQNGVGLATGTLIQTGGDLVMNDGIVVGRQGTAVGVYEMTGGSLTLVNLRIGGGSQNSHGTMTVSGANTLVISSGTGHTSVGSPGTGMLTLENSAVWTHNGANPFLIGSDNNTQGAVGGNGTLHVLSGALFDVVGTANFTIGRSNGTGGNGTVLVDGGTINIASGFLNMAATNAGAGSAGGTGTLTLKSGAISTPLLNLLEGNSTVNFDGGTATLGGIAKTGVIGSATVNFNGTRVIAQSSNVNFIAVNGTGSGTLTLNVDAGGLILDTNDNDIAVAQPFTGAGGLTKVGDGTLTLSGANGYAGATVVQAGTLALGADDVIADASDLTLNSATLDLAGFSDTMGALALDGTATINFGLVPGANSLVFADSSGATWSGSLVLENFEVGVDTLSFSDGSGLTLSQLDAIQLAGFTVTGLDANGVVQFSAIPEPSQFAMVMVGGLVVVIATARRRRRANA